MKADAINRLVLDASVVLSWCFPDESSPGAEKLLDSMADGTKAIVPAIWPFEIANALLTAERRKRLSTAQVTAALRSLTLLPIAIDAAQVESIFGDVLAVARQRQLTQYDAAYLELALREALPLATLDDKLRRAARHVGISLVAI
jgi:predicted nucleic acid-binding protein